MTDSPILCIVWAAAPVLLSRNAINHFATAQELLALAQRSTPAYQRKQKEQRVLDQLRSAASSTKAEWIGEGR